MNKIILSNTLTLGVLSRMFILIFPCSFSFLTNRRTFGINSTSRFTLKVWDIPPLSSD